MNILVVEQQPNPSTDFFVRPWVEQQNACCHYMALTDAVPAQHQWDTVIFVRYITPRWRRWVARHRQHIGRLVLFIDDDVFSMQAHTGLPLRYRLKLLRYAWRHQFWLRGSGSELWVSTPWLAKKYANWSPLVLPPRSLYEYTSPQKTLFYHGSASHGPEFEWLYPVLRQVLEQDDSLSLELIGDRRLRQRFTDLPRVHVLHPMSWPSYQALLARPGRTIGLAPLLANRFNAARAPTKFFDITRAGAVGIYADHPVYRSIIQHEHNGLLLPMEQQAWADTILQLSKNEQKRDRMIKNAQIQI